MTFLEKIEAVLQGAKKPLHYNAITEHLLTIRSLSPSEFEQLARTLLIRMGFEAVEVSGGSGDGGIDVRGVMVTGDVIRTRMAVQVKHWKKTVEPAVVRE